VWHYIIKPLCQRALRNNMGSKKNSASNLKKECGRILFYFLNLDFDHIEKKSFHANLKNVKF
jgi:hypothetical protein